MSVNRYDIPADFDYQPLPYDDILRAGLLKQRKADENLAGLKQKQIGSIEEHDEFRNKFNKHYSNAALNLYNSGIDPASKEFSNKARQIALDYYNNENLIKLERSIKNKEDYLKKRSELESKGKYAYWRDSENQKQQQYKDYKKGLTDINPYINPDGSVNEFSSTSVMEAQDREKPVYDMFDKVKENGYLRDIEQTDEEGNIIGINKGNEGIARDRLYNLIYNPKHQRGLVDEFLNTDGGRDFIDQYKFDYPQITDNQIRTLAIQHMQKIADLYVHNKSTERNDFQYAPEHILKDNQFRDVTYSETPVINRSDMTVKDISFDDNGEIKLPEQKYRSNNFGTVGPGIPVNPLGTNNKPVFSKEELEAKNQENKNYIEGIKKTIPQLSSLSNKEAYDKFKEIVNNHSKRTLKDINPSGEWKEALLKQIPEEIFTRAVSLEGGNKDIHTLEGDGGIMDQLGYDYSNEDDRELFMKNLHKDIKIQPAGTYAGSFVMSVTGKDGDTRRIYIKPDEEQEKMFADSKKMMDSYDQLLMNPEKGIPFFRGIENNKIFYPIIELNEDGTVNYSVGVYNETKDLKGVFDYDKLIEHSKNQYKKSNLIRSNLTTDNRKKS